MSCRRYFHDYFDAEWGLDVYKGLRTDLLEKYGIKLEFWVPNVFIRQLANPIIQVSLSICGGTLKTSGFGKKPYLKVVRF